MSKFDIDNREKEINVEDEQMRKEISKVLRIVGIFFFLIWFVVGLTLLIVSNPPYEDKVEMNRIQENQTLEQNP